MKTNNITFGSMNNHISNPVRRLTGGWQSIGATQKAKDTRTSQQILQTLDYFANANPEISKYIPEIKKSQHASLAADIAELANHKIMMPVSIDMRKQAANGESAYQNIFRQFAQTSQQKPEVLDFMQEVINNTDTKTSQYTLLHLPGMIQNTPSKDLIKAATKSVKTVAESTLDGGNVMDFSKQKDFVDFLGLITSPQTKPEKAEALTETIELIHAIGAQNPQKDNLIDVVDLLQNSRPHKEVMENLQTLYSSGFYAKMDPNKPFNITEYANKNINLKG